MKILCSLWRLFLRLKALFFHSQKEKQKFNRYHRTKYLLSSLAIVCFFSASCQKQDDDPPPPSPWSDVTLSAAIEDTSAPNQYHVRLTWHSHDSPPVWLLARTDSAGRTENLTPLSGDKREFVDFTPKAGETYRYDLSIKGEDAEVAIKSVPVAIYSDIIIKDRVSLSDLTEHSELKTHRLFLEKGGYLIMEGRDVQLTVDEIHSDSGSIETFRYGQTAPPGSNGRSGGHLKIQAKFGYGVLNVIVQGENGGMGLQGAKGKKGSPGSPGKNGECGYRGTDYNCELVDRRDLDLWRHFAQFGPNPDYYKEFIARFYCRVPTGDGSRGGQGEPGSDGGKGGNGGDSGEIYVRISEASQIEVKPSIYPGEGGNGGPWGDGGDGGTEGVPGRPDRLSLCGPANFGTPGPRGPIGRWGQKGSKGKAQTYCLSLGTHMTGDCSMPLQ